MGNDREEEAPAISIQQMVGRQPLRQAIHRHMEEKGVTIEALSNAMGFENPKIVQMYLQGIGKIPMSRFMPLVADMNIEVATLVKMWLTECAPDILEALERLPAPPLLTESERRMIRHLRTYTDHPDTELIVADGSNLVALVMAR